MKKIEHSFEVSGRKFTLTTGNIAEQATAAVMASCGETVVLATVVSAPMKQHLDYFPLFVDYQERLYAGGRIKGSRWVKREGRPSDDEILTSRLIDRSIRPLFPKEYTGHEVQLVITLLSVDLENSVDITAAIAASSVLAISSIPWMGPVGVVKIGRVDGKLVVDPIMSDLEKSDLDLVVSATEKAVVMVEAGGKEIPEGEMVEALNLAHGECKQIVMQINKFVGKVGTKKEVFEKEKIDEGLVKKVKKLAEGQIKDLVSKMATKEAGYEIFNEVKNAIVDNFEDATEKETAAAVFENLFKAEVRKLILSGKRADGRKHNELRALSAEVSVLPRTHGSAIFQRGQTQALSIATLGEPSLGQTIETAEGEETKRYMHHYSMPPYSTGETGRIGSPSRREIGHGALAERALLPVIPSEDKFPYAIRVVTEVLSSNGSTSMASTCGSTLSLMDAGVPIKAPVAGIAMGVIVESEKEFAILTDIVGIEDGNGDMDFKVAGTEKGITALQLDVKTLSLTVNILETAFKQAREARMTILEVMKKAISAPRSSVSKYAPKIKIIKIEQSKIGELIGPGGKIIKGIISRTGAQVDVDDDGNIFISAINSEDVEKAVSEIESMFRELVAGEIYDGVVRRIQPFGAFIEILPGKEGMVHVSDMSDDFVGNPSDVVKIGQDVKVRVKEVDELGRINLSMLLDHDKPKNTGGGRTGGSRGGNYSGGYKKPFDRGDRRGGNRFSRSSGGGGGPHFPTSRLLDQVKGKYER
ncbi:MAG: Polyribonucleotide nucleotidyltransferase [Candidatus Woesebacteria bacterium GW2011_GWA1_39_21]|uniref:Polyribonucleotide nucleotidyltransferase n=1 Tax=Candidatus Woesebacteria bacterium GW2011_GWA1_39_21 TaxID=1618550 RepID=A0A0G0N8B8_9BACT|nr:MAG: Polyribonucleotide nucleotidyltransferase [Candidatus Woesebacteria bacterium GW2011_GWA1_39_21]